MWTDHGSADTHLVCKVIICGVGSLYRLGSPAQFFSKLHVALTTVYDAYASRKAASAFSFLLFFLLAVVTKTVVAK